MIQKIIQLPIHGGKAFLTTYVIENTPEIDINRQRPAVLICPGGGYEFTSDREAEAIAIKMLSFGFQAFVLRYSVTPHVFPQALTELATSVQIIRRNSQEWCVDPEKIIVAGFSAGGHLAASLGVFWQEAFLAEILSGTNEEWRPNGLMLAYPVISSGAFAHEGSFQALLGERVNELKEMMSLEKQVTKQVPPAFLWHTVEDEIVPVENSFLFAQSLRKQGISFALHLFPKGRHGLSLASTETSGDGKTAVHHDVSVWPELFANWVQVTF